jgi:hypothetical protein
MVLEAFGEVKTVQEPGSDTCYKKG